MVNTVRLTETELSELRIELVNDGGSISDILLRYGSDDTILIENGFASNDFANIRSIQRVELADGTVFTDEDLIDLAVLYGTDGDDVISGAARIDGLGGNDVITGFGSETDFIWRAGSGNDTIVNRAYDGGNSRVVMDGLTRDEVSFARNGLDMVITLIATGETVTVQNQFQPVQSGRKAGVREVVFEDGSFGRDALANASLVPATAGDDVIIGGWDNEFFRGLAGDDDMNGGQGSDIYVCKGDGNDTITDNSNGFADIDVLTLTDVNDTTEIAFSRRDGSSYDLQITILETGEVITLANQLAYGYGGIERVLFANGSFVALDGIEPHVPCRYAGTWTDRGDFDDNTLNGLEGDDLLNGGEGADTYIWTRGDGNDTISETMIDWIWIEDPESEEGGYGEEVEFRSKAPTMRCGWSAFPRTR